MINEDEARFPPAGDGQIHPMTAAEFFRHQVVEDSDDENDGIAIAANGQYNVRTDHNIAAAIAAHGASSTGGQQDEHEAETTE